MKSTVSSAWRSPQNRFWLWSATLLTAGMGIVNLVSAVTPRLHNRVQWLEALFPFPVRAGVHVFAAVIGFLLLVLSANLLRRKRVAWLLTVALLILSIISNLIKGWDYEESILAGVLLVQLLLMRQQFTAQSDRPSIAQGIRGLIAALLFTLAYGTLGFYLLDHHYSVNFDLGSAIVQTLAMFFTEDNAGLQPTDRFGRFFADSIYIIGAITLSYGVWMLLRPVLLRSEATKRDRQRAQAIVEQYGRSSLARFTLFDDKDYYFSPSGQSVIAYVPKGRGAIALGDPIGPAEDRQEAIVGFQQFCARNDWYPAFYQTLPDDLELYESLGLQALQIGEEAIAELPTFTLEGKPGKNLRTSVNKMVKAGHRIEFYPPPIAESVLKELRSVSDEWLEMMQGSEKKFSLGWFNDAYLRDCEIAVVRNADGRVTAFANVVSEYRLNEATIDLMRHRQNVEHGTMDFLFVSLFQHFKEQGYDGFNLGLSALSGIGMSKQSPRLEKAVRYLYTHLNQFYNFQGLHAYKEKFHPNWEPRYLIYPGWFALPDVVVALVRADSGDRLLDYFKPTGG
ncbi:phosphatidylglycerol lysyltransferase domain-containing protein [Microcoleus sp. N3A4]|uniref:phosphatidylglycerol lysyltransferase domain-containing protein n=1 Tax=Microcoleus sp. N3A4 TaxID=3055379 RepID=UPI002FD05412